MTAVGLSYLENWYLNTWTWNDEIYEDELDVGGISGS